MTTRVTIKNEDESKHNIILSVGGTTINVPPGGTFTRHVWQGVGILIEEAPVVDASHPWSDVDMIINGVQIPND